MRIDAARILSDDDLKKIKILMLKEGVKRVDRHGFSAGAPEAEIDKEKLAMEAENNLMR